MEGFVTLFVTAVQPTVLVGSESDAKNNASQGQCGDRPHGLQHASEESCPSLALNSCYPSRAVGNPFVPFPISPHFGSTRVIWSKLK